MRMENGQMTFVEDSIDPRFYGRVVVLLAENGLIRSKRILPWRKSLRSAGTLQRKR